MPDKRTIMVLRELDALALVMVDVQPSYFTSALEEQFPAFKRNVERTLEAARRRRIPVIHVLAEYTEDISPHVSAWSKMAKNQGRPAFCSENAVPFAVPVEGETVVKKPTWVSCTQHKPPSEICTRLLIAISLSGWLL